MKSNDIAGMLIGMFLIVTYGIFSVISGILVAMYMMACIVPLLIALAGAIFVAWRTVNTAKEKGIIYAIPAFCIFNVILFAVAFIPISGGLKCLGDIILPTDTISSAIFSYAHAKFPWVS